MSKLTEYNESLSKLFYDAVEGATIDAIDLDSIDVVLRDAFSIEEMREAGCFFTGYTLTSEAASYFIDEININSVILDPTCGAGNLLILCSRKLPIFDLLSKTLEVWGGILCGMDILDEFVYSAKLRIVIDAISRGAKVDLNIEGALSLLNKIRVGDALSLSIEDVNNTTHVIMNPPFTLWNSPNHDYWKKGKVNAAGVILDHYLRILPESCFISAILPDVLRSGTRYSNFRQFTSKTMMGKCKIWGRFNNKTDVDVFILYGKISKDFIYNIDWFISSDAKKTISSLYDVRVGPLVAYRDPEVGTRYPYFHPKNTPSWTCILEPTEYRQFSGSVIKSPFVLIKRTSSPTDKFRAAASIVNVKGSVAVENHMIVIKPISGHLEDCKKLMKLLKNDSVNDFLNQRIRLRHLTVGVIKEIPLSF